MRTENGTEYGDLVKFVDFDYVERVARLNAATLGILGGGARASGECAPADQGLGERFDFELGRLPGWTGHGIRGAVAIDHQPGVGTCSERGQCDRATMKLSKDNVVFAVRALDKAGHRSLTVTISGAVIDISE